MCVLKVFLLMYNVRFLFTNKWNKYLTRMKTSISSEALTQFGAEKIAFPQKPDRHTDIHKDIRTDISNYI